MATLLYTPYQLAYAYAPVPSKFQATGDANVGSLAHPLHGRGNQSTKCRDLDFFQEVRYPGGVACQVLEHFFHFNIYKERLKPSLKT